MDTQKSIDRYKKAGLDTDKLIIVSSNEVDVLMGNLGALEVDLKKGDLSVSAIILDSVGGIQGETAKNKVADGEVASAGNSFGGNAKVLGPILQTLLRIAAEYGVTMFFVQHCIQNMEQYGPRFILVGGQKLRFLVHNILYVESVAAKDASLLEGDQASESNDFAYRIGKKIRFRCEKSRQVIEGRKGEFWMNFEELKFARPEESLFNLATNLGVIGHPRTPELETTGPNKGNQKIDKDGNLVYKESKTWWEFPVGGTNANKFNGAKQTMDALASNKNFFNDVFSACMATKNNDAVKGAEMMSIVDSDTDETPKKGKKK
jgi:hypothetical protein